MCFKLILISLFQLGICISLLGQESIDFAHDILPTLKSRCAECHSNGVFKGGLSLESKSNLLDSGSVEIGSHDESDLFLRLLSDDPDYRMPPEGSRLTSSQIENFRDWIDGDFDWPVDLTLKENSFERPLSLRDVALENDSHPIDQLVEQFFTKNSTQHPKPSEDYQFIRRAALDLLGVLPTKAEVNGFQTNTSPDKHVELIDSLLERNEDYAAHWMTFWNDLLRNDYAGTGYIDGGRKQITKWLHRSLLQNKPFDQFARQLINPNEESVGFIRGIKWRGEVNSSQVRPLQFSQNVSQVFLGINMKCASCHDSFIDDWKLSDAYGMAAILSEEPLELHRCDVATGEMAKAEFVFPSVGSIDGSADVATRLSQLSELLVSKNNGRFPRTIVNRLWQRMAGRGLVHPVDSMANQAWSEDLLDFLASDLVNNGYDLKRTLRLIATSKIYRSQTVPLNEQTTNVEFVFRGIQPKRMSAEQFVDAVWQITSSAPKQINAQLDEIDGEQPNRRVRASLVNSNAVMRTLGRPNREQVVSTRPAELSTLQALDLSNGQQLFAWLNQGAIYTETLQKENDWTDEQVLQDLFMRSLSRNPTRDELQVLLPLDSNDKRATLQDAIWILLMYPEFQLIQ